MENHLRAVDESVGGGEVPVEAAAEPKVRERRMRPKLALPTDRMKKETAIQALRAVVTGSRGGERGVSADDIGARIGISAATAGLSNGFFAEAGWIEKVGRGEYKPTQAAVDFVQKFGFNETEAASLLAPSMQQSWYFAELSAELQTGPVPMSTAVNILAQAAGAGAEYTQQLESVVDWLEYVGLVVVTDGQVQLGQRDLQDLQSGQQSAGGTGSEGGGGPADREGAGTTTETLQEGAKVTRTEATLLSLNFDFAVTAAELKELDPEQIRAIFDAVGKVAAIKASRQ